MASFTLAELGHKSNEVAEATSDGPVEITAQGRRKFVLMTVEQFDQMRRGGNQKAHHVDDIEPREREELITALESMAERGNS